MKRNGKLNWMNDNESEACEVGGHLLFFSLLPWAALLLLFSLTKKWKRRQRRREKREQRGSPNYRHQTANPTILWLPTPSQELWNCFVCCWLAARIGRLVRAPFINPNQSAPSINKLISLINCWTAAQVDLIDSFALLSSASLIQSLLLCFGLLSSLSGAMAAAAAHNPPQTRAHKAREISLITLLRGKHISKHN